MTDVIIYFCPDGRVGSPMSMTHFFGQVWCDTRLGRIWKRGQSLQLYYAGVEQMKHDLVQQKFCSYVVVVEKKNVISIWYALYERQPWNLLFTACMHACVHMYWCASVKTLSIAPFKNFTEALQISVHYAFVFIQGLLDVLNILFNENGRLYWAWPCDAV